MDAKVSIEKIQFKNAEVVVNDFTIANPNGYKQPIALRIDMIDIEALYRNYLHKAIHIKEIEIHNAELVIEFKGKRGSESNWSHIIGNIGSEPPSKKSKSSSKSDKSSSGRYATIDLLKINELRVTIITPGQKNQVKVLRNMRFKNVITKKGDITKRIAQVVLYHMIFNYKNLIKIPQQFVTPEQQGFFRMFNNMDPLKNQ